MKKRLIAFLAAFVLLLTIPCKTAFAGGATDEILNYTITAHVNDDASVTLNYDITWKVLDDKKYGPLSWVQIGIPNSDTYNAEAISANITSITLDSTYAKVYLDRDYYKDEIVNFSYSVTNCSLYESNILTEGESVFYFTPGWFDGIKVDEIVIKWEKGDALNWSHGAGDEGDYLVWRGSLGEGEHFQEISVTYNNSSYSFDLSKNADYYNYYNNDNNNYDSSYNDDGDAVLGFFVFFVIIFAIVVNTIKKQSYKSGTGFTGTTTKKKITRTLIKYYPTCPGCGAARPENKDKCDYCGRSFIESEEVLEEKEIEDPKKFENEGTFRYGSDTNTFVRVHVTHVHVPVSRPVTHSSCVHSSCACAHSCACACACACAGGGRAGCSTKDFYNTGLKLKQLERKKKA